MTSYNIWLVVLAAVIGYFLGSISFSYILSKKFRGEDVRERGSGNAGTTNMLRNYGWKLGLFTLVLDVAKGVFSALIGLWIAGETGMFLGSLFAVIGHMWPIFLKFRGGKGIATAIGAFFVIQPLPSLIILVCCVIFVLIVKIMSVGSMLGMIASAVAACFVSVGSPYQGIWIFTAAAIALLTVFAHRENIARLLRGEEKKLSMGHKKRNLK